MTARLRWMVVPAVVVLAAGGFFTLFEPRTEEVEEEFVGEARTNPLLAARRTLRRMGLDARTVRAVGTRGFAELAPHDAVILIGVGSDDLGRVVGPLEPWIAGGGRLVVALGGDRTERGDQEKGGAEVTRAGLEEGGAQLADGLIVGLGPAREARVERLEMGAPWGGGGTTAARPGARAVLALETSSALRLHAAPPWRSAGPCLAGRAYGTGSVAILCTSTPLVNRHLGRHDHAEVLWRLATARVDDATHAPPGRVWMVLGVSHPGVIEWLWQRFPYGIVGLGLLLAIALAGAARRFGPILEAPASVRRSVMEHVEASAGFQWRRAGDDALLGALIDAVEQAAARRHPGFRSLDAVRRTEVLAALAGVEGEAASALLSGRGSTRVRGAGEVVRAVRTLERVRRRL